MSFKDIKNQPQVISLLEKAFEKGRLPHALLFAGPSGAGQRPVATEVAKILFCESKKGPEACGSCVHCRQLGKNSHPDFYVLEPEEDSRVIKIETIRALIARANLKPFQANSKVFVIDRAECMNEASQNALLKTLEEPEGKTTFILISYAAERLLPTLRSRTQVLNFVPPAQAPADAESEDTKKEVLNFLLGRSGAPPDLSKLEREEVVKILDAVILDLGLSLRENRGDPEENIERIETLAEFKERIAESANLKLALAVLWNEMKKIHA